MNPRLYISLLLLSAATLAFEINLTRLFSVAQFYHFAFMIVSLALLGYGASGSALALFPGLVHRQPGRSLGWLSLATSITILGAYLLVNWLPFDSFSIAVDRRQAWILVLHFIALATPFFFSGMVVSLLLAAFPKAVGQTYAVNLLGSAFGCLIALAAPAWLGGEGTVLLSSGIAAMAAIFPLKGFPFAGRLLLPSSLILLFTLFDLALRLSGQSGFRFLEIHLSPYKGLSYTLQYPDAEVVYRRWNAFSRLDVVRSPAIHSLPGMSYRYLQPLPQQDGLLVDGDDLSPVMSATTNTEFIEYLPSAIAFQLLPNAYVLILEPRGGLDVFTALGLNARRVTAVEVNPLIVEASDIYRDPRVQVILESDRSYLRSTQESFDLIIFSLANAYHSVRSGAYSLAEDYRYTVEAFKDALARLEPDGLLVVTRWLQDPPSEDLRAFALAVTALERVNADPRLQIVAFRGYNTATILVKNAPFTAVELQTIRNFTAQCAFDLSYAPDIQPEETNLYNILPNSVYYQTYLALLDAQPRQSFYDAYSFEVNPPIDDRPFFGHYFKWSQAKQVIAEVGKTWQPFGGAGYFVIIALLIIAILLAGMLILMPMAAMKPATSEKKRFPAATFFYFGLIGFAFLLVEIPLIQQFILFLSHPAYAITAVIFLLLLFSALGSRLSDLIPLWAALVALVILLISAPFWLSRFLSLALGLSLGLRLVVTVMLLAPLGFLMGIPFPKGIRSILEPDGQSYQIPWAWAVNGAASVVASVLAALLALTFGFSWVLRLGALCYAGALVTDLVSASRPASPRQ